MIRRLTRWLFIGWLVLTLGGGLAMQRLRLWVNPCNLTSLRGAVPHIRTVQAEAPTVSFRPCTIPEPTWLRALILIWAALLVAWCGAFASDLVYIAKQKWRH